MEILNGSSFKISFKRSISCLFFGQEKIPIGNPCLDQNIIGHFWRKTWNISKYGKSTFFPQLWLNATFRSSIHFILFFWYCKACNLIFLKHQESCLKTPWAKNAIGLNLVTWNWSFFISQNLKFIFWLLNIKLARICDL